MLRHTDAAPVPRVLLRGGARPYLLACLVAAMVALQAARWHATHAGAATRHAPHPYARGFAVIASGRFVGGSALPPGAHRVEAGAWTDAGSWTLSRAVARGPSSGSARRTNAKMIAQVRHAARGERPAPGEGQGGQGHAGAAVATGGSLAASAARLRPGRWRNGTARPLPHTSRVDPVLLRAVEACAEDVAARVSADTGKASIETWGGGGVPPVALVALALHAATPNETHALSEDELRRRAAEAIAVPRFGYGSEGMRLWLLSRDAQTLLDLYFAEVAPLLAPDELPVRCAPVEVVLQSGTRGWGICVDAVLYARALRGRIVAGSEHQLYDFFCPDSVHLLMESYEPASVSYTRPNWHMVNHEHMQTNTEDVLTGLRQYQDLYRATDVYLTKSRHAQALMQRYLRSYGRHARSVYVGHTSLDVYDPHVPKDYDAFVHVAGKSGLKHTRELLEAWLAHPEFPRLTVIIHDFPAGFGKSRAVAQAKWRGDMAKLRAYAKNDTTIGAALLERPMPGGNVVVHNSSEERMLTLLTSGSGPLSADELRTEINAHGVHLCASEREGFGHYINEARAVGALVVTTDFPPMNELVDNSTGLVLRPDRTERYAWQTLGEGGDINAFFTPQTLARGVQQVVAMPLEHRRQLGARAREAYERDASAFEARMAELFLAHFGIAASDAEASGWSAARGVPLAAPNVTVRTAVRLLGEPVVWLQGDVTSLAPTLRATMPTPLAMARTPPSDYATLRWPDGSRWPEATDFGVLDGRPIRSLLGGRAAVSFDGASCLMAEVSEEVGAAAAFASKMLLLRLRPGKDVQARQVLWSQGGAATGVHVYVEGGRLHVVAHALGDGEGAEMVEVACSTPELTPDADTQLAFSFSSSHVELLHDGAPLNVDKACTRGGPPELTLGMHAGETTVGCSAGAWRRRGADGHSERVVEHAPFRGHLYEVLVWNAFSAQAVEVSARYLSAKYGALPGQQAVSHADYDRRWLIALTAEFGRAGPTAGLQQLMSPTAVEMGSGPSYARIKEAVAMSQRVGWQEQHVAIDKEHLADMERKVAAALGAVQHLKHHAHAHAGGTARAA